MSEQPIIRFAREVLGFRLFPRQAGIVEEIYRDGIRTAVLRLGRRSGKGRIAATVATFEATVNAAAHLAAVPVDEQVAIVVVATSQKQARIVHRFVRAFLRRPELASLVVRDTDDEIELTNGIVIVTVPCHAASARGLAIAVAIFEEAAWFAGRDGSPLDPKEIWDALVPGTAQFPERRVIVMSTPRWSVGWFATICEQAGSGRWPDMRHWHGTTAEMNPSIPASFLEQEQAKDPAAFRREYEAEFDAAIAAVFDDALVRAAIADRADLPALPGQAYVASIDAAFTGDTFALVLGHVGEQARILVDRVRGWTGSRANPVRIDETLDEIALICRAYNGAPVLIDQFAAEPIRQGLAKRGLQVYPRPWTQESKVDAVAAMRRALYGGRLEIPRHRELIAELVSLEQRPSPSGRPRIAAPGSGHDDYASALMALVAELEAPPAEDKIVFFDWRTGEFTDEEPPLLSISPY
ncbi:MAG: hypothetical protein ABSC46_13065 [Candidatus Limnocylindrales bacterium]|jgi:hypothetical protein